MVTFNSHIYKREDNDEGTNWILFIIFILLIVLGFLLIDVYAKIGAGLVILSGVGSNIYLYKDWGKKDFRKRVSLRKKNFLTKRFEL